MPEHADTTQIHRGAYFQSGDPGAVGSGKLWLNSSTGLLKYRNGANDAWLDLAAGDHGTLTGLADDDHTQYHNNARGDARYPKLGSNTQSAGAGTDAWFLIDADGSANRNLIDIYGEKTSGTSGSYTSMAVGAEVSGSGTQTTIKGLDTYAGSAAGFSGTVTNVYGIVTSVYRTAGTVTNAHGLHIFASSGTITNAIGIYVEPQTGGTLSRAAYLDGDVEITGKLIGLAESERIEIPAATGVADAHWRPSFPGIITKVSLLADISGSVVVDIWKDTYANFPPDNSDSITSSTPPTLSSAIKMEDSTLTSWVKTFAAGDVYRFNVDSFTTLTHVTLVIDYERT